MNEQLIWDTLMLTIKNPYGVAGLMGNLYAESGLNPMNLQNSYEKKLGYTDERYTKCVDNGTYTNFVNDSAGYGLAQWTYCMRKKYLLDRAKKKNVSIGNLNLQLEYLLYEITTYPKTNSILKSATSVKEASDMVLHDFERPANQSEAVEKQRAAYGQKYFDTYAKRTPEVIKPPAEPKPTPFKPYVVRVTIDNLPIRIGPGTNYAKNGCTGKGSFTIIEEKDGKGATKWGRLKSKIGWINLDKCRKI